MKRVRTMFAVAIPSMFVGGLLFGNQFGHAAADTGEVLGFWPAAADVAATGATKRAKRTPPMPPMPPMPPTPPTPPTRGGRYGGGGISVRINNGQVQIDGLDTLVNAHLEAVRQMLRNNPNIPQDLRDRITARMDRIKGIVDKHLKNVKTTDIDQLGDEMEKMGDELDKAMEGLDSDLQRLGQSWGKDFGKDIKKAFKRDKWATPDTDNDTDTDTDDDSASATTPDVDVDADDGDVRDSIGDLKDMALKPAQKDAIVKLRTDSDARVAAEKKQLEDASRRLETALGDPKTSDADISRYVDQVSAHEASIRKARLIAWANARRVLDADQVRKIEDAAAKKKPR